MLQRKGGNEPLVIQVGDFLTELFQRLDDEGIGFCVLRGYQDLPEVVHYDLDLYIPHDQIKQFETVFKGVCRASTWALVQRNRRFCYDKYVIVRDSELGLAAFHIDAWQAFQWRGIPYASSDLVIATRWRFRSFWIPLPGVEAAISLPKEYIAFGRVKDKGYGKTKQRITKFVNEDPESFIAALSPCFGKSASQFMLDSTRKADWARLESEVMFVRRKLIVNALRRRLVGQLTDWVRFLWGHFSDKVLHPSGLFICLIGPDGSGKTTISRGLQRDMKGVFNAVRYYHGHWGLLPELKTYYNSVARLFGKEKKETIQSEGVAHNQDVLPFSLGRALLYVLYYSLEHILGHFVILRAKGLGELVLFDRYFYDYTIQSTYSRVPRWLLRLIELMLPRPDVLIWLRNQPEVIHRRKPELNVSQIREQAMVCERIIERHPKGTYVVWTNDDPEVTLGLVRKRIFEFMAYRVTERG